MRIGLGVGERLGSVGAGAIRDAFAVERIWDGLTRELV